MGKEDIMNKEEKIKELLNEADDLKIKEDVLNLALLLQNINPKMEKTEAIQLALKHLKNHR